MAQDKFWTGTATAIVQVDTLTVGGTIDADDVFIITMTDESGNTEALSVTGGSTDADTVAATVAAAFNASTHYMFTPITALAQGAGGTLTLTADSAAGIPFSAAATTTEAGGGAADLQTFIRAATTVNSGPNDWNSLENWRTDDGNLPGAVAADTVYVEGDASGAAVVKYGLLQSGIAQILTALNITRAQIGENGEDGRTPTYLDIIATNVDINYHKGPGTPLFASPLNIDTGDDPSTIVVHNTGTNSLGTEPSVNLLCNDVATDIFVKKGNVGIAIHAAEATTMDELNVSFVTNITADAKVFVGVGITLDDIVMSGGLVELSSSVATLVSMIGGTLDTTKSTADITIAAIKIDPPAVYKHSVTNPAVTLTAKIEPVRTTGNVTYTATEL